MSERYRALLVGVWTYGRRGFGALRGVENDLKDLRAALCDATVGLFEDADVQTLPDPTTVEFERALTEFVTRAGPDDRLLFYFAGHGHPVDGQVQLCLREAEVAITSTMYEKRKLLELLKGMQARSIIIILDCCYAGLGDEVTVASFADETGAFRGSSGDTAPQPFLVEDDSKQVRNSSADEAAGGRGIVLLQATSNERAIDTPQGGRFTQALVKALKSARVDGPALTVRDVFTEIHKLNLRPTPSLVPILATPDDLVIARRGEMARPAAQARPTLVLLVRSGGAFLQCGHDEAERICEERAAERLIALLGSFELIDDYARCVPAKMANKRLVERVAGALADEVFETVGGAKIVEMLRQHADRRVLPLDIDEEDADLVLLPWEQALLREHTWPTQEDSLRPLIARRVLCDRLQAPRGVAAISVALYSSYHEEGAGPREVYRVGRKLFETAQRKLEEHTELVVAGSDSECSYDYLATRAPSADVAIIQAHVGEDGVEFVDMSQDAGTLARVLRVKGTQLVTLETVAASGSGHHVHQFGRDLAQTTGCPVYAVIHSPGSAEGALAAAGVEVAAAMNRHQGEMDAALADGHAAFVAELGRSWGSFARVFVFWPEVARVPEPARKAR